MQKKVTAEGVKMKKSVLECLKAEKRLDIKLENVDVETKEHHTVTAIAQNVPQIGEKNILLEILRRKSFRTKQKRKEKILLNTLLKYLHVNFFIMQLGEKLFQNLHVKYVEKLRYKLIMTIIRNHLKLDGYVQFIMVNIIEKLNNKTQFKGLKIYGFTLHKSKK